MVQGVSGEGFDGDWNPLVIHKKSHLYDRERPLFFTDAHFAQALFQPISFHIKKIPIGFINFEIEVGDIIIDDRWRTVCFFHQVRIDPSDDLVLIERKKIKCIINIVRIKSLFQNRLKIIGILSDGGRFGGRV